MTVARRPAIASPAARWDERLLITGTVLCVKSRLTRRLLGAVGVVFALTVVAQGSRFTLTFLPEHVTVVMSPLLPCLLCGALTLCTATSMPEIEASMQAMRVRRLRLNVVVAISTVAVGLCVAAAVIGDQSAAVAARSALVFLGLGLMATVILGNDLAWLPLAVAFSLLVFVGRDASDQVRPWALPLREQVGSGDLIFAVIAWLMGTAAFSWYHPSRVRHRTRA